MNVSVTCIHRNEWMNGWDSGEFYSFLMMSYINNIHDKWLEIIYRLARAERPQRRSSSRDVMFHLSSVSIIRDTAQLRQYHIHSIPLTIHVWTAWSPADHLPGFSTGQTRIGLVCYMLLSHDTNWMDSLHDTPPLDRITCTMFTIRDFSLILLTILSIYLKISLFLYTSTNLSVSIYT